VDDEHAQSFRNMSSYMTHIADVFNSGKPQKRKNRNRACFNFLARKEAPKNRNKKIKKQT